MLIRMATSLLAAALALQSVPATAESLTPFSTLQTLDDGWTPLTFPDIDTHTRYRLVDDQGTQVLRADTDGGASGLIHRVDIEPGEKLVLHWRWKVDGVYAKGDARRKDGDDYPARIYVAFAFEPDKAGFFERAKRKAVELVHGDALPGSALNYIWANRLPRGESVPNPFSEETRMIAVQSGSDHAGQWMEESRDLVADYRAAFGEDPPRITGIAVMTDGDNTGSAATAYYGDIRLSR
ncbi:DUF3047 domain-containing protein [Marinobacter bohaiensis]|uniref:DUF3047 domain-containing protein n=1 Tax=Marinobacter bohaiensis TaxID=2201898 RepID=UPI000DAD3AAA|nr:DUF3047 domain-containing protein [Marinobacter bohaiensis]